MSLNEANVLTSDTQVKSLNWNKKDTVWMLSLYGTAIGAGTLFLPIGAGLNGIFPLLLMSLLIFPMTFYSHRALCRFVLSGSTSVNDITEVVDEHFGSRVGNLLTFLYFFAIYPILLMYSIAITNTTESFIVHQLGLEAPPRALISIVLILALMIIIRIGQHMVVKSMSVLVYPFIAILIFFSLYLIPYWNEAAFQQENVIAAGQNHGILMALWLGIPIMVFSFNHSPIISSFAVSQKQTYGYQADEKSSWILRNSHILMVSTVMFFVFSCVLSLSPQDLALAKQQNISILSYLANHFNTPFIAYVAPFVAFIAISKSFLGHYLGASEGLFGLIAKSLRKKNYHVCQKKLQLFIDIFMVITCWIIATVNPSILGMIETLGGPVIAMILFLMPMYAMIKVPAMKKFRHLKSDIFITLIGFIALSAIIYSII
ncbi:HAAAP family serine/threonine permease [Legionella israelensis]|uniref:serine/threonine transporter n=1 Tax=Legionella israelensis TaxID=454 RepID=UPI00117D0DCE|nr:serine/threonine transporter [Legionella israelensis]QDP72268.1 HAAAP family serine/threonine permease [Legionella israelensis]